MAAYVLLKCDGPSHPDWRRLGVVRAAGVDNRWKVPAVLARETRRVAGLLKYTEQAPVLEGMRIGPGLGLSSGGGWRRVARLPIA